MTRSIPLDAAIAEAEKSGFLSIEDLQRLSQPQAGEPVAAPQHVAYFDDGQFHWMSGIAPRNCELYASPQPANPAQVTEAMVDACANILAQAAGCAAISQQRRNLARMALTAALSKQEPVVAGDTPRFVYSSVTPVFKKDGTDEIDHLECWLHTTIKGDDQSELYERAKSITDRVNASIGKQGAK